MRKNGRHLFITDETESLLKYQRRFDAFKRIADAIGLSLPEDYDEFLLKYLNIKKQRYEAIEEWCLKHEHLVYEFSAQHHDYGKIYKFRKMMDSHFNLSYHEISSDFVDLIQHELK